MFAALIHRAWPRCLSCQQMETRVGLMDKHPETNQELNVSTVSVMARGSLGQ